MLKAIFIMLSAAMFGWAILSSMFSGDDNLTIQMFLAAITMSLWAIYFKGEKE